MQKKTYQIKTVRIFSETLRKDIVSQVSRGQMGIMEATREYGMSVTTLYKWIRKYSGTSEHGTRIVMEKQSEEQKRIKLSEENKELKQVIGEKQLKIEYLEKLIELASKELGVDLKKNFEDKR